MMNVISCARSQVHDGFDIFPAFVAGKIFFEEVNHFARTV